MGMNSNPLAATMYNNYIPVALSYYAAVVITVTLRLEIPLADAVYSMLMLLLLVRVYK